MSQTFQPGDKVEWHAAQGAVRGTVKKKLTSPIEIKGHHVAASEENARGHLVITAPTGGSAGVMPAIVYGLTQSQRALSQEKVRQGLLAGAAIAAVTERKPGLSSSCSKRRLTSST